ncbi:hypothetical protein B0J14DRAFT_649828 [Halenospora varia]|nr:hypothetical protein B0J14DRAFT_649828 [Halenospora varia]
MGAVVSCIRSLCQTIGACLMAIVNGIASILQAIVGGIAAFFSILISCLTCGRSEFFPPRTTIGLNHTSLQIMWFEHLRMDERTRVVPVSGGGWILIRG